MAVVALLLFDQRHDHVVHARKTPTPYPPMTLDGRSLVVVSCIMMALTTVWTIMRIMSKYLVGATYLIEEYFYVLGQTKDYQSRHYKTVALLTDNLNSAVVLGGAGHNVSDLEHNIHVKCFYKTFITDIIIVVLPTKVVSTLQMSKPHKIALYLIFGAGIIIILFSGVRLYHTLNVDYGNITKSFASAPYSAVLQNGIAVTVASSPILRPIFSRTIARWLNLSIRGNGRTVATGPIRTKRTLRGPATTRNRSDARTTLSRSDGFKQMTDNSDADDSLSWEMKGLETLRRKSDQAQISAHAEAQAPDSVSPLSLGGGISVTHTFTIESHVTRLPSFSGFVSTDNQPSKADVA
ncbi:integral membrane protein [Colletotrichum melonis]|uniref:Integral membrane protein n=1 Tax=Colletotrichum melonis TaxID=1209925 RepID=A0AAI9UKW5_9PEZI|nr:integral membrane protein [Colletotrichum melonis]